MHQTESIKELVTALSKAQGKIENAKFNKVNPHFKSRYADLTSVMDACREPLSTNGLSVMQYCETVTEKLMLVTMLAHISGEWIKSYYPLYPSRMDSQSIGSAMTYAKRYSLAAMLGIVADEEDSDDDGESAVGRGKEKLQKSPPQLITPEQLKVLKAAESKLDTECYKTIWAWLKKTGIESLENIPQEKVTLVLAALDNAVKHMEQKAVKTPVGAT